MKTLDPTRVSVPTAPGFLQPQESQFAGKRIHLIGIGGSGMSGLAEVLIQRDAIVSGTDCARAETTSRLLERGVRVEIARDPGPLPAHVDLVVASAAIPESHPHCQAARTAGCRVVKYATLLGELMAERVGIAIAGTHGKTTTTAWTAFALRLAGLDPTFVVGAHVPQLETGAAVGQGPHFVAEACEYDRSFLQLHFHFGVILNVEDDHLDYYRSSPEIEEAFATFAERTQRGGVLLFNGDDGRLRRIAESINVPHETFGIQNEATWRASNVKASRGCHSFDLEHDGNTLLRTTLQLPGRHHVYNALATSALAMQCGVEPEALALALSSFKGAYRRLTHKGTGRGVTVLDDYAHHPTEVQATLRAARDQYQPHRLWVVFQPHQHSRTRIFLDEFARSFDAADAVFVPDIYSVRDDEQELRRMTSGDLVERIRQLRCDASYCPDWGEIVRQLDEQVQVGDLVITMGAGDIWQVADELVERLGNDR